MLPFDETYKFEARVGKILLLIAVTAMTVAILCCYIWDKYSTVEKAEKYKQVTEIEQVVDSEGNR